MNAIMLCNVPNLDINHNHSFTFRDLNQQIDYFLSKKVMEFDDTKYHRVGNSIKIPIHFDDFNLMRCNYLLAQNHNQLPYRKTYFYFIVNKEYVNSETTKLTLKLDVIQTYLFEIKFGQCFIERQHYNPYNSNGNINIDILDRAENLEVGEYIVDNVQTIYDYNNKGGFIVASSSKLSPMTNTGGSGGSGGSGGPGGSGGSGGPGGSGGSQAAPQPSNPEWNNIPDNVKQFINTVYSGANAGFHQYGLFASVTLAQGGLETGWNITPVGNNLFGIKADSSWTGKTVTVETWEDYGDGPVQVMATFRAYDSISDSVLDRCKFLQENSNYVNAGVFSATSPEEQCQALKDAGYATDPDYVSKLVGIINNYNLKVYDV